MNERNRRFDVAGWSLVGAMSIAVAALLTSAVLLTQPCRPGDAVYIGGAFLVAGCPERGR